MFALSWPILYKYISCHIIICKNNLQPTGSKRDGFSLTGLNNVKAVFVYVDDLIFMSYMNLSTWN